MTASTLAGIYAAVTSAVATLKGPLHGGANEESMKMLEEIGTPDRAEAWLMERLETKEKIMGFGHRVYKKGDSRVPVMREIGRDLGKRTGKEQSVPICEKLEEVMDREKHLCANVRSLCCAGVLDARFSARAKHASVRCVARRGLVRARNRATRQQSSHSTALSLHWPKMRPFPAPGSDGAQDRARPADRRIECGEIRSRSRNNMLRRMRAGAVGQRTRMVYVFVVFSKTAKS